MVEKSQSSGSQKKVFFIVGASGSGKSSFVNKYSGRQAAVVSDGVKSCTMTASAHETLDLILIDTRGLNDTDPDCDDREIMKSLLQYILIQGTKIEAVHGIIYVHPANDVRCQLDKTLALMRPVFGQKVLGNVIVLCTKWDLTVPKHQKNLETTLFAEFKSKQIKFIKWISDPDDPDGVVPGQLDELESAISGLQPVKLQLFCAIVARAIELAEEARRKDLIEVVEGVTSKQEEDQVVDEWIHTEESSKWGIANFALVTWFLEKQEVQTYKIIPSYPPDATNKEIVDISIDKGESKGIKLSAARVVKGIGLPEGRISSQLVFPYAKFGQAMQKYVITVKFRYTISKPSTKKVPKYEERIKYMESAWADALTEKLQEIEKGLEQPQDKKTSLVSSVKASAQGALPSTNFYKGFK